MPTNPWDNGNKCVRGPFANIWLSACLNKSIALIPLFPNRKFTFHERIALIESRDLVKCFRAHVILLVIARIGTGQLKWAWRLLG